MGKKRWLAVGTWGLLAGALVILGWLALDIRWRYHLEADANGFYYSRAKHFLTHKNLTDLGYNEYQPGAVLFFLALSPSLVISDSSETYLYSLFAANLVLVLVFGYLIGRFYSAWGRVTLALLLVAIGPIALYRFDILVSLAVVAAFILWQKGRENWAGFWLGVATSIKIYPFLLLPYFGLMAKRQGGWRGLGGLLSTYLAGLAVVVGFYVVAFRVAPRQLLADMRIHSIKPVHVESVWGTILTLLPKPFEGKYALGKGSWGIFGIDPIYQVGPLWFYNYFWIVILADFYLWLYLKRQNLTRFDVLVPITILSLFLVFSKIVTAQYLMWFVLLLPLTTPRRWGKEQFFLTIVVLAVAMAGLSQYVYPLHYNELLGIFYTSGGWAKVFWVLAIRNGLLVIFSYLVLKRLVLTYEGGNNQLRR